MKIVNVKLLRTLNKLSLPKPWDTIIILLLTLLTLIPVFIILHQNFIDPEWPAHLDRILLFLLINDIVTYILHYLIQYLFFAIIILLLLLPFCMIFSCYRFYTLVHSYCY